jgi:hypothetical protein
VTSQPGTSRYKLKFRLVAITVSLNVQNSPFQIHKHDSDLFRNKVYRAGLM